MRLLLNQHIPNSFGVQHKARRLLYLYSAADVERYFLEAQQPILLLGCGTNILFTQDFDGDIIIYKGDDMHISREDDQTVLLSVGAAKTWHELVIYCAQRGWWGLENLALIPGSVGAAPVQNIGAYGVEIKEQIECVTGIDLHHKSPFNWGANACNFSYRSSRFKQNLDQFLITNVTFRLHKHPQLKLQYADLANAFSKPPTDPLHIAQQVMRIRTKKLPDPLQLGNAGSFFKNPIVDQHLLNRLQQMHHNIIFWQHGKTNFKISAAQLIELAGFKGMTTQDGAGVSKQHALVLVNHYATHGKAIAALAQTIAQTIEQRYGVGLEAEVRIV